MQESTVWLTIGVPVLVLLGLVAARVTYYLVWRRHWDSRPQRRSLREPEEVIVIRSDAPPATPPTSASADPR